ncbi:MAG: glycine zipper family protein [Pseudomonadota bacterium]
MHKSKRPLLAACLISAISLQGCTTSSTGARIATTTAMDRAVANCVAGVAVGAIGGALISGALGGAPERGAIIGAAAGLGRCAILIELAAAEDKQQVRDAQLAALNSNKVTTSTIVTKSGRRATVRTKVQDAPLPPPRKVKIKSAKKTTSQRTSTPPSQDERSVTQIASTDAPSLNREQETAPASIQTADARPVTPSSVQATAFAAEEQDYTLCRFTELIVDMDGGSADVGRQKWCKDRAGSWQPIAS